MCSERVNASCMMVRCDWSIAVFWVEREGQVRGEGDEEGVAKGGVVEEDRGEGVVEEETVVGVVKEETGVGVVEEETGVGVARGEVVVESAMSADGAVEMALMVVVVVEKGWSSSDVTGSDVVGVSTEELWIVVVMGLVEVLGEGPAKKVLGEGLVTSEEGSISGTDSGGTCEELSDTGTDVIVDGVGTKLSKVIDSRTKLELNSGTDPGTVVDSGIT